MVTRREQLGTSEAHLAEVGAVPPKKRNGKGNGKGRSKKGEDKKDDKTPRMKRPAASSGSKVAESPKPKVKAEKKKKGEKDKADDKTKQDRKETEQEKKKKNTRTQKAQEKVDQGKDGKKKRKSEQVKDGEATAPDVPAPAGKVSKTWAGRWIPTDPFLLCKMSAIRQVYDSCVAKKIRSQSTFQNPFFVTCSRAFKKSDIDKSETTFEQFVAVAELEVEGFLKLESVSH